ncbi:hypothetical protein KCU88_g461, partial [Aureobasidium melanogenum]
MVFLLRSAAAAMAAGHTRQQRPTSSCGPAFLPSSKCFLLRSECRWVSRAWDQDVAIFASPGTSGTWRPRSSASLLLTGRLLHCMGSTPIRTRLVVRPLRLEPSMQTARRDWHSTPPTNPSITSAWIVRLLSSRSLSSFIHVADHCKVLISTGAAYIDRPLHTVILRTSTRRTDTPTCVPNLAEPSYEHRRRHFQPNPDKTLTV